MDPRLPDRFWSKVQPCPMSGCWLWCATIRANGYGVFGFRSQKKKQSRAAHRVSFETLVGTVSKGLEIDHLCRVRSCVNPAHLEAVTKQENIRRGNAGLPNR